MPGLAGVARRARQRLARSVTLAATRLKNNFYLYLATFFSLFIVVDAVALHVTANMRQTAFDKMVRYRIIVPRPDPDIVIADINEASLAAMAKDYGRWPWPRQVLGEFLENLEAQRPRAVVFDILFSDPDVYNPDSDDYFNAAIARTTNAFFPLLRLDPASDSLSQIRPGMIPGVTPNLDSAQTDAHVAVVLPHLPAILRGGRLGFNNIYPDPDGIVREYRVYRNDYGWTIPSLPARVIRDLGYGEPVEPRVVLNWRGKPFSYRGELQRCVQRHGEQGAHAVAYGIHEQDRVDRVHGAGAPGLMNGGQPLSPYARSAGQTSRLLPPTFMSWRASVQHLITPPSGTVAGSPYLLELSKTVPSVSRPS